MSPIAARFVGLSLFILFAVTGWGGWMERRKTVIAAEKRCCDWGDDFAFAVGEWEISPQVDIDLVDGEQAWVLGLTFGTAF